MNILNRIILTLLLFLGLTQQPNAEEILSIEPVYQETPVWCWAAVSEMIFRHYEVPSINNFGDYQCGITALVSPACEFNCGNCVMPAGTMSYLRTVLNRYPQEANKRTGMFSGRISSVVVSRALSSIEIKSEIDSGNPIVIGISPTGFSFNSTPDHVALIIGYDNDQPFSIIVNDPYPYMLNSFQGRPNPYLINEGEEIGEGQYKISLNHLRSNLLWRESIYRIRCQGDDCP